MRKKNQIRPEVSSDASGVPSRHPRPTTQRTTRKTVDIEIMYGFNLQTDSNDAWRGLGDSVTTPLNKYYIWQMHQHQRIRNEPRTEQRDPVLGECHFNLNEHALLRGSTRLEIGTSKCYEPSIQRQAAAAGLPGSKLVLRLALRTLRTELDDLQQLASAVH